MPSLPAVTINTSAQDIIHLIHPQNSVCVNNWITDNNTQQSARKKENLK